MGSGDADAFLILVGGIVGSFTAVKLAGNISAVNTAMPALWCTLFITATGMGIAWVKLSKSLRKEPMELLSVRQEV